MIYVNTRSTEHTTDLNAGVFSRLLDGLKGLADGWRGYSMFIAMNDLSDAEIAARGLTRADLPLLALDAIKRRG